jgi:uncharacterized membrane protein
LIEFIWKYLVGPVIADAKNAETAVWQGVTAHTGYNIFNTVTWGLVAVAALLLVRREFRKREIELSTRTAINAIPFILLGGILRFLEDAAVLPFVLRPLVITPVIYFVIAALFIGSIPLASWMASRSGCSRDELLKNLGYVYLTPFLGYSVYMLVREAHPLLLAAPIVMASILTGGYYLITRRNSYSRKEYLLIAFSQFFGGSVSTVSLSSYAREITGQSYQQKQLLPQLFTSVFGEHGILILKACIVALAVYFLEKDIEDEQVKAIAMIVLFSIGLATGLRVLLRLAIGI